MRPLPASRRSWPDARTLFGRHLDLSSLGSRQRGLVRCIFHQEKTASLSVDLDAGLFHCFGCGEQGGIKRFAELVGDRPPEAAAHPGPPESEFQRARRRVLDDERHRRARLADWGPYLHSMTWLRTMERLIAWVRATATDSDAGWTALDDAATLERFVDAKTAELEGLLAAGRVA